VSVAEQLDPVYTAACQFGMRGLRLFPTEFHGHKPLISGWQQQATNDVTWIDRWFSGRNANLALCCGPQLNTWPGSLLMVDIDPINGGKETFNALKAEHGWDLADVPVHLTPSGGRHLFYLVPDELCITGTDVLGPGIDLRGGRAGNVGCGYGMMPPSIRPSKVTGELVSYGVQPERGLLHLDPPMAPDWLLDLLRAYLNPPKTSAERHPSSQPLDGDNPWDWVRNNVSWPQMLEKHQWSSDGPYWARPGKTPRQGTGGYLHDDGRFAIWTPTDIPNGVAELGHRNSDGSYSISLADFITAYEFDGDRARFGREYRKMMPPPDTAGRVPAEAEAEPSADALGSDRSWSTRVDLTNTINGKEVLEPPSILQRTDGVGLFYRGMINGIHGESGLGKGWVALTAAVEQVRAGNIVIYLDMEDTSASIVDRLKRLGLTGAEISERFWYFRPDEEAFDDQVDDLVSLVEVHQVALVVLDSLGEAFGLEGINEDKDAEVNPWLRRVPRRLAEAGAAVIIVDHATKAGDNPLYPSGSKRKRAAVGGAQYLVEATHPMSKGQGGKLRLTCAKDRHGFHKRASVAAEIVYSPSGDDLRTTILPSGAANSKPTEQERLERKAADLALDMARKIRPTKAEFKQSEFLLEFAGNTQLKYLAFKMVIASGEAVAVPGRRGWFVRGTPSF
jgi:hypothetical protein